MKFSDNRYRGDLDTVFVKRTGKEMAARAEYASNLWDVRKACIGYSKEQGCPVHLYKVPARDVKIGENVYTERGNFLAYRSN